MAAKAETVFAVIGCKFIYQIGPASHTRRCCNRRCKFIQIATKRQPQSFAGDSFGVQFISHSLSGSFCINSFSFFSFLIGEYVRRAIDAFQMDQGIVFCRTKLDCDNLENYFNHLGGGMCLAVAGWGCCCLRDERCRERNQSGVRASRKSNKRTKYTESLDCNSAIN